jgi:HlyD family secretion protein
MVKKAILIVVPIVIVGGLIGWRLKTKAGSEQQLRSGMSSKRATSVEAATAGPAVIAGSIMAAGNLDSPFKVQLTSRIAGKINMISVREGDAVTAGQVLVKIDPATAQASYNQSLADLAQAKARLAQAKIEASPNTAGIQGQVDQQGANYRSAQAEFTQTQRTVEATNSSLESDANDAKARVVSAQANVTTAQAGVAKEKASQANFQIKADRAKELFDKGYIAEKDLQDANTALDVQEKQVQIANATLAAANTALQTAKNQEQQARAQLNIARSKGKADIAAAQARVRQAQSTLNVAKANTAMNPAYQENLNALRAAVTAAEAQVSQARTVLGETDLRSSINGVITARNSDEGALASPGQAVLVIQSLDWLFFIATIPVELGDKFRVGQTAKIVIEGIANPNVNGTITNINPSADPASRQIALRIRVENKDHALRPGMFGKINFMTDARNVEVAVPKEAVTRAGKKATVAVIGDDNKVQIREVTLGAADEKVIEIREGVKAGEKVVTLSYDQLKDGKEVKVGDSKGTKGGEKGESGGRKGQNGGERKPGEGVSESR